MEIPYLITSLKMRVPSVNGLSWDKLFGYQRNLYKHYGGINQSFAINVRVVNVYDPDDIETIMSTTRFNEKRKPYDFFRPWLCQGLLVSNGEKWHQRRKLLTQAFHFDILKKYMQTFTEQAADFLKRVAKEEGKATDIYSLVSQTTLNVICETAMGTAVVKNNKSIINKYFDAVEQFGQIVATRTCRAWFYFDFIFGFSSHYNKQKELVATLHEFTTSIIKARKEENINKRNQAEVSVTSKKNVYSKSRLAMLDLLLQNEKQGYIDFNGIREEVDTFMFEGQDTTATALSFFILRVANEPIIQNKIYEEMRSIFGDSDRLPTLDDLNDMKYLECCIKESLRLYPSVPFIARYLAEEVTLSGYKVPSGTIAQIHVFDIHRSEKTFPDPEDFIPERFLPDVSAQRHPYAYIPFSAGPRNCIGQKFAMMEMKTLLSSLFRKFQVEPVTRLQDLKFAAHIVLRTTHPIYARFRARK